MFSEVRKYTIKQLHCFMELAYEREKLQMMNTATVNRVATWADKDDFLSFFEEMTHG